MENNDTSFNDFDNQIRERLTDFEPSDALADWQTFNAHLEAVEQEADHSFDQFIKSHIETAGDTSQRADHWAKMSARLDAIAAWQQNVWRYKALELAILLLTTFTTLNVLDSFYMATGEIPAFFVKEKPTVKQRQLRPFLRTSPTSPFKWNEREGMKPQNAAPAPANGQPVVWQENGLPNNYVLSSNGTQNNDFDALMRPFFNALSAHKTTGNASRYETQKAAILQADALTIHRVMNLDMPIYAQTLTPSKLDSRKLQLRMGFSNRGTVDFASTAYADNKLSNALALRGYAISGGYGANLNLSVRKGRWELETGIGYAAKTYAPVQVERVSGSFDAGYLKTKVKQVQFDLVNVPVQVNYHLGKPERKWHTYVSVGASVNAAAQTNYDLQVAETQGNNVRASAQSIDYRGAVATTYKEGVLQGGNLKDNYYLTANAGVGVEYKVGNRWSVYGHAEYQHPIGAQSLGLNQDRISTLALSVGAKARL